MLSLLYSLFPHLTSEPMKLVSCVQLFVTPWTVALFHPWNFSGKSTGVGCHFLLQGIFLTQGSNPGLPHCRQMLYRLSHQGSPHLTVNHIHVFSSLYLCTSVLYMYMYNHKHVISFLYFFVFLGLFPGGSGSKESVCNAGYLVWLLGQEDPLEKGMATHSSILSWRIPWTQDPGGLQSMGSQRVR